MPYKLKFRGVVEAQSGLLSSGSDRGYDAATIIKAFMAWYTVRSQPVFAYRNYLSRPICFQDFNWKKTRQTLSTPRYKTLAIDACLEKTEDTFLLKLAQNLKRIEWIEGLRGKSKPTTITLYKTQCGFPDNINVGSYKTGYTFATVTLSHFINPNLF